jgi:hypothetical protein
MSFCSVFSYRYLLISGYDVPGSARFSPRTTRGLPVYSLPPLHVVSNMATSAPNDLNPGRELPVNEAKPESESKESTAEQPPSAETLRKVEDYTVLDKEGKKHTFRSLYAGPESTGRVLVIFIRHFFCGVSFPAV